MDDFWDDNIPDASESDDENKPEFASASNMHSKDPNNEAFGEEQSKGKPVNDNLITGETFLKDAR